MLAAEEDQRGPIPGKAKEVHEVGSHEGAKVLRSNWLELAAEGLIDLDHVHGRVHVVLPRNQEASELHLRLARVPLLHHCQLPCIDLLQDALCRRRLLQLHDLQRGGEAPPHGLRQRLGVDAVLVVVELAADEVQPDNAAPLPRGHCLAHKDRRAGECAGRERQGHPHGACPVGMRGGDEVPPDEVQEQQQHPVRDLLAGHQGVPFEILCAGVCHCDALQGVLELVARVLDRRKRPRVMPSRLPLGLDKAHEAVGHPDPQVAAPLEGADHAVAPRRHHAHDHVAGRRVCCGSLHLRGDGGHAQDVDPNLRVPATVRLFSTGARRALVERRDHLPEGCLPGLLGTLVVRAQDDLRGAPAHVEHKRPILCQGAWKRRPILHLLDVAESQLRVMVAKEFTPTT
mmetsp:Transcript_34746/g.82415  ORF Transcript_34746/g.82415 Transcript_34746/m.82415 type:complete len:400 (+) Transcript_34746:712-1911(+)